jgi:predicted ABC-type ATPase
MKPARPWFVLVAGINGAGKSTFAQKPETIREFCGLTATSDEIEIINPDLVTKEILKEDPRLSMAEANKRAADDCEDRVWRLVEDASRSFVIETVLSTDKYKAIVKHAQAKGFRFLFIYVVLASVEEAISRVASRVAQGGHNVPTDKIRKRWPRSFKFMPWFWRRADLALLFFNGSSELPIRLAEKDGPWVSVLQRDLGPAELRKAWPRLIRPAKGTK